MRIDAKRLTETFTGLVEIDNPSLHERLMAEALKERFIELGFRMFEDCAGTELGGDCGNLFGFLDGTPGADNKPLLFSCHMDSVEPASGKHAVVGLDGRITTAGNTVLGADDLAGLAAILEAVRTMQELKLPHRPLEVLFTVAEEFYLMGAAVFDYTQLHSTEGYVLDLNGEVGDAANQAPSVFSFKARVIGRAAHAGFAPEKGIHAIAIAADAITQIRNGHHDDHTTLNIGKIEGGTGTNIVPDSCIVQGEVRSWSHERAQTLVDEVKLHFLQAVQAGGAVLEFESTCQCEAYCTPIDSPVSLRFIQAAERCGITPRISGTFGGSDNNHLARNGISGIVLANAMNDVHSSREHTTVAELSRIAELTLELMTACD